MYADLKDDLAIIYFFNNKLEFCCFPFIQAENQTESTLILHWVPNVTICRNPKSLDSPVGGSPRNSALIDNSSQNGTPNASPPNQDKIHELATGSSPGNSDRCSDAQNIDLLPIKEGSGNEPNSTDLGNESPVGNINTDSQSSPPVSKELVTDSHLSTCTSGIYSDDSINKTLTTAGTGAVATSTSEPRIIVSSTSSTSVEDNTSSSDGLDDFVVVSPDDITDSLDQSDKKSATFSMTEPILGIPPRPSSKSSTLDSRCSARRPLTLSLSSSTHRTNNDDSDCDEETASISSGSTGGPDSERSFSPTSASEISSMCDVISLTETAESIAETHNLLFPEVSRLRQEAGQGSRSSSPTPSRPSVFSVNLGMCIVKSAHSLVLRICPGLLT